MSRLFQALWKSPEASRDVLAIVEGNDDALRRAQPAADAPAEAPSTSEGQGAVEPPEVDPSRRIENLRLSAGTPTLPFDGTDSRAAEQYRLIRTRLLQDVREPRLVLVSSPTPGDGKTITALNLATALALKSDSNVLLVDGDLRRPAIAALLGISGDPGLGAVLEGSCPLEGAIVEIAEVNGLSVLPAGRIKTNPTELLDSDRCAETWAEIRRKYRFVIIDSPPVSSVADYHLLEKLADGVILILRLDHTNRSLAYKALESVPREKQLGVVLNCAANSPFVRPAHPYYYYSGDYK